MRKLALICVGTVSAIGSITPANANPRLVPAGIQSVWTGTITINGPISATCNYVATGFTAIPANPALGTPVGADQGLFGAAMLTGTNPPLCSAIQFANTTFTITSATSTSAQGLWHGVQVVLGSTNICGTSPIPFTFLNGNGGAARIHVSARVGNCQVSGSMQVSPPLDAYP